MFNDTSGHGTCTNYVLLKCQKCMWEGSLIQTFRAALCLERSSVASSSQKGKVMGTPGIQASACFLFLGVCFNLQLPYHFFMSSDTSSFSTQNLWLGGKGLTSSYVWDFQTPGSQLSRQTAIGLCNCIQYI